MPNDGADVSASTASRLLYSHACTKFGSKAWEFATPLMYDAANALAPRPTLH